MLPGCVPLDICQNVEQKVFPSSFYFERCLKDSKGYQFIHKGASFVFGS